MISVLKLQLAFELKHSDVRQFFEERQTYLTIRQDFICLFERHLVVSMSISGCPESKSRLWVVHINVVSLL